MALNLEWDFRYAGRPIIPIRLTCWQTGKHLDTEAMLDTGADKTFVDSAIALALGIDLRSCAQLAVVGLSGPAKPIPAMELDVLVLHGTDDPAVTLQVGFVDNLAMTVGNLVGCDFFASFDLGLSHSIRTAYVGRAR
jgi:hypothetical protein